MVHWGSPVTGSTVVVHGPGVNVLYTSCEPCFVDDYQSTVVGILGNKASSEDSLRREGKILVSSVNQYLGYLTSKFSKVKRL